MYWYIRRVPQGLAQEFQMDCRHSPWGNRSRHRRQQGSDKGLLSPPRGNCSQHCEPSTSAAAARPCSRLNSFHMEPGVGCCGQHSDLMTHDIPWGSRSARRGRGTSARQCGRRSAAHRTASDAAPATPSPPSPSCSPAVLFMSPLISVVVPNLLGTVWTAVLCSVPCCSTCTSYGHRN